MSLVHSTIPPGYPVFSEPRLQSGEDFPRVQPVKSAKSRPKSSSAIASDVSILEAWTAADPTTAATDYGCDVFRWAPDEANRTASAAATAHKKSPLTVTNKKKRPRDCIESGEPFCLSILPGSDFPLSSRPAIPVRPPSAVAPNPPLEAFPGFCILLGTKNPPAAATIPLPNKKPSKFTSATMSQIQQQRAAAAGSNSITDYFHPRPATPTVPPQFNPSDSILILVLSWQMKVFCLEIPLPLYFMYRSSLVEGSILWLHGLNHSGGHIAAPNKKISTWRMNSRESAENKKKRTKLSSVEPESLSDTAGSVSDFPVSLVASPSPLEFLQFSLNRFNFALIFPASVPFPVLPILIRSSFHIVEPDGKLWNSFSTALSNRLNQIESRNPPEFPKFDESKIPIEPPTPPAKEIKKESKENGNAKRSRNNHKYDSSDSSSDDSSDSMPPPPVKRSPATPAPSRLSVVSKSPAPPPIRIPGETPRSAVRSLAAPSPAMATPRQLIGFGHNGTPITALTPRTLNIPADELSSTAQAKALKKLKRLQKELKMETENNNSKAKEEIQETKKEEKTAAEPQLPATERKEKEKRVSATPIRPPSSISILIQTPTFRRLSDEEFDSIQPNSDSDDNSSESNSNYSSRNSNSESEESESESASESASASDSAESVASASSQSSNSDSVGSTMADANYSSRHLAYEKEEKEMRLEQRKDSVEVWISCDSCRKWRLSTENIQKAAEKQGFYYCGNASEPKPTKCNELDDWICRCVGRSEAARLSEAGIQTVEGLKKKKQLIAKLTDMGFYIELESLTIRPMTD